MSTLKIEQFENELKISSFSHIEIRQADIPNLSNDVISKLSSVITQITFDIDGVQSSDYNVLIFFKAVAEINHKRKLDYNFINANEDTLLSLSKLGFNSGKYLKKEYRKLSPPSLFESTGGAVLSLYADLTKMINYCIALLNGFLYYLRNPSKLNKGEILYYADKTGADAIPIVSMICFLMGGILAFQGLAQLSRFGLSIFVSNLVGFSIVRELGPLMVAIICTGRAGSSFAAELGTMKVNEEIDALVTMGLKPINILVIPKVIALVIVMPMLTIIGDFVGVAGGGLITALTSQISFYEYITKITQSMIPANIFESITKSIVFAFLVAAIGCFRGMEADNDAKGVGNATTSSVVSGIFLIVLADALLTYLYPIIMKLIGINY